MCHGQPVAALPSPALGERFSEEVTGYAYGPPDAPTRILVLPDIYGCNPFYQQVCRHYENLGARVLLIDPFHAEGELPEVTRDAAFARRHRISDRVFLDACETYAYRTGVTGVLGFCLGGYYIFELARRRLPVALAGLYGFPQGMANFDPLPVPFDYLHDLTQPFTMLMGAEDVPVGPENVARLAARAPEVPAMDLTVYPELGHGFLPLIDSSDARERASAADAFTRLDALLLTPTRRAEHAGTVHA